MVKTSRNVAALVFAFLICPWVAYSQSNEPVSFSRDIRPLLSDRCFQCHGPDENKREAEMRLDIEAGAKDFAISPGDPEDSDLITRIFSTDDEERMPPPDSGKKSLTREEAEMFKRWIEEGAPWDEHWAFTTVKRPKNPKVENRRWAKSDIDKFILARLEAAGIEPSAEASRETLIRRLSFDLTGLPPTLDEIDAFVNDKSRKAYERVVDRLLDSPHYGERMAINWLDGARYADTNGLQNDFRRIMWPWRDWVVNAFNENMPFDQFTVEQIAGDLLPDATESQRIATGFNRNNHSVTEGGSIEQEWWVENIIDRVEATSTVFLGLTMGCARCHDHKYDSISQAEFYKFFAFFAGSADKGFYNEARGNTGPMVTLATEEHKARLAQFDNQIQEMKDAIANEEDEDAKKKLETRFKDTENKKNNYNKFTVPSVMVMKEMAEARPTYRLMRGQYDAPDESEELTPEIPEFLPQLGKKAPANRLGLAEWLVDRDNPLTARVAVNRLWQKFFGRALVTTTENFGMQSEPPSHPELLDWLAYRFMRDDWDLKKFQKRIVMSATYRQSSVYRKELEEIDPENALLARGPRFRMPAELIRDNALAASGLLSTKMGGPSVKPYQPEKLWDELAGGASQGPYVPSSGEDLYRRSLYTYRKRTVPHPTLTTFDAPGWEVCTVSRSITNTPLQALAVLNDVTYVEAARNLAQRMLLEAGAGIADQIAFGFRLATGRRPTQGEVRILETGYQNYWTTYNGDKEAAEQLLSNGESPVAPEIDRTKLAALTTVAGVILNLDETITKE